MWYNKKCCWYPTGQNTPDDYDVNVRASEPTLQSDGGALVDGDLGLIRDDLENYPNLQEKIQCLGTYHNGDQVTSDGIIFVDLGLIVAPAGLDSDVMATLPNNILAWNKEVLVKCWCTR